MSILNIALLHAEQYFTTLMYYMISSKQQKFFYELSPSSDGRMSPRVSSDENSLSPSETTLPLPHSCTADDLPRLMSKTYKSGAMNLFFDYDGQSRRMFLDQYTESLEFLNDRGSPCIKIFVSTSEVYLSDYYYSTNIDTCPEIPHDAFFHFLHKLGVVFRKPVTLIDASRKSFKHTECTVPGIVFSLGGKPTFYERYGFRNDEYTQKTKELQTLSLQDLVDQSAAEIMVEEEVLFYTPNNDPPEAVQVALTEHGMNMTTSVQELAKFLVGECKKGFLRNSTVDKLTGPAKTHKYSTTKPKPKSTKNQRVILEWLRNVLGNFDIANEFKMIAYRRPARKKVTRRKAARPKNRPASV